MSISDDFDRILYFTTRTTRGPIGSLASCNTICRSNPTSFSFSLPGDHRASRGSLCPMQKQFESSKSDHLLIALGRQGELERIGPFKDPVILICRWSDCQILFRSRVLLNVW